MTHPTKSTGLTQALRLQDFTYECLVSLRKQLTQDGQVTLGKGDAATVAQLVKAWESCQERIRIHRNKPMPGSLRPEKPKRKSNGRSGSAVFPSPIPMPSPTPAPLAEPEGQEGAA